MLTGCLMEMPAAQFRVRFFELLDEVAASGEEIVITKHGKPVVRVLPVAVAPATSLWGCMKGRGRIVGDIMEPVMGDWCSDDLP